MRHHAVMSLGKTNSGLRRRLDLFVVREPAAARRDVWFFGLLGSRATVGTVTSVAVGHWSIALITMATAALSTFMFLTLRGSLRRVPETTRWIEETVAPESGGPGGRP